MASDRDTRAIELARAFGLDITAAAVAAGAYAPSIRHENTVYLSGQIPKIGNDVVCVGPVGSDVTAAQAQDAAAICALRLLGVLMSTYGSLNKIRSVVRLNVFVQTASGFDKHTEVADGASAVLASVLQCETGHARTAVGVLSLPRNASVEADMTVAIL